MQDKKEIFFVVVNSYAASHNASARWTKAEKMLRESGLTFHMNRTGRSGNVMEITFDACMAGYRRIIAAGGDGTVHDVLNGIGAFVEAAGPRVSFSDFTIGVIPLGSGNDWIKSLGVPNNISDSVKILSRGTTRMQDVVKVSVLEYGKMESGVELSRTYMANVGGVGIDAQVCEIVNAQKIQGKRGKILYVTSLIKAIKNRVPMFARVVCDGKVVFDGACLSIAFGVGKYSGGGMRQTPDAVMDDGRLDMTIILELSLWRILRQAWRLFTGSFLCIPEIISAKSGKITVIPYDEASMALVEVDGEVVGKSPVELVVLDDQINVIVGK